MDSLTYFQLLRRNRSFRRLWWGQVISELGNWFNFIAGLGLVRLVSHGDPTVTTIMLLARMVPFTVFAPLAGAFVDRWSRRMVMIASDIARVAIALGFLLVRRPEDLWLAYVCTALLSVFGVFFEAAKSAAMPNITPRLPPDRLRNKCSTQRPRAQPTAARGPTRLDFLNGCT